MESFQRSRSSSPLSSLQSLDDSFAELEEVPSSPLSSARSRSPTPPSWALPRTVVVTPPPSQDAGEEMPHPRKRRKIERPDRTTRYLDLTEDAAQSHFDRTESIKELQKALRGRRKIVVIAGAGISVSAGIPDFRSSNGLFASLKGEHKLKGGSGKQLFDAAVYKDADSTSQFHEMVRKLSQMSQRAKPTTFHHMLARLATEGRLLRLYTQNVDGLETQMPPLGTEVPLPHKGPWPQTVQLHGGLEKMMCQKCREIMDFDADLFAGSETPTCPKCRETDDFRTIDLGRRSHGIGRLRPRIVLYNEANPDDEAIGAVSAADMRTRPDAIVVVGTSMKIPGVRRIVSEMCKIVRGRRDGTTIWINPDPEPTGPQFEDCWDLIVKGDSDQVANLTNLRKWDDPIEVHPDAPTEYTDSDLERILARQGEVMVKVPPSPLKKTSKPTGTAVITPPHSQSGESQQKTLPNISVNTPVRIKLVVGEKSESAEKEQKSRQQIQLSVSKTFKNPASRGRGLKDVLGKGGPAKNKISKTSYKRKNTSKLKSALKDRSQSKIEAKVTKSKHNVEVLVPARKSTASPRKASSPAKQLLAKNHKNVKPSEQEKGLRPDDGFTARNGLEQGMSPHNSAAHSLPTMYGIKIQNTTDGPPRFPLFSIGATSSGSTPALISGDTTPHDSPSPRTPPPTSYGMQSTTPHGSPLVHNRRDTISPKGNVPRDMMRLLN